MKLFLSSMNLLDAYHKGNKKAWKVKELKVTCISYFTVKDISLNTVPYNYTPPCGASIIPTFVTVQ